MAEKKVASESAPKKKCFMITPIGDAGSEIRKHADWVFKFAVQPVMAEKGLEATRADMMDDPFMINDSVFAAIDEADICVADLTNLNANVFYELGVRHALEKPVIHIAHVGTRIPFDTANYRTIWFDLSDFGQMNQLKVQIAGQVDTIFSSGFKLSNPLTQARGFQKVAESVDSKDQLLISLQNQVHDLARQLDSVRNGSRNYAKRYNLSDSVDLYRHPAVGHIVAQTADIPVLSNADVAALAELDPASAYQRTSIAAGIIEADRAGSDVTSAAELMRKDKASY